MNFNFVNLFVGKKQNAGFSMGGMAGEQNRGRVGVLENRLEANAGLANFVVLI